MMKPLFRLLSPAGPSAKLNIFIFHRALPAADPLLPFEPSAEQFEWIVRFIARTFHVMPLGEAARRLREGSLPPAAAVITFDDGYADNLLVAWPILKRHGVSATFFIATAFLEGGRMWNDDVIEAFRFAQDKTMDLREFGLGIHRLTDAASRVRGYEAVLGKLKYFEHSLRTETARQIATRCAVPEPPELMLSHRQLRLLHAEGAEIGGHTRSHPILEGMDDSAARQEIVSGKEELEALLAAPVQVFAYPNGAPGRDYSPRHADMVRQAGFAAAVSTRQACATATSDPFQLPRFTPWERTPLRFALRSMMTIARST
ncbi:MAG: polysaccharide deacetylase family protein [Betaproteobacteria bacterium]|nr:polysaccharide deacetylase family protein [Betaproteobacteria bacterium]